MKEKSCNMFAAAPLSAASRQAPAAGHNLTAKFTSPARIKRGETRVNCGRIHPLYRVSSARETKRTRAAKLAERQRDSIGI